MTKTYQISLLSLACAVLVCAAFVVFTPRAEAALRLPPPPAPLFFQGFNVSGKPPMMQGSGMRMGSSSSMMPGMRDMKMGSTTGGGKTLNASCMQAAMEAREGALITAWSTFASAMTDALNTRLTALTAAWSTSEGSSRNAALAKAWKAWDEAKKKAEMNFKSSRKTSWETFRKTMKESCKVEVPKDEVLDKDTAGSISL